MYIPATINKPLIRLFQVACLCLSLPCMAQSADTAGSHTTLDAVRALHQYVSDLSGKATGNGMGWLDSYEATEASNRMKFTQDSQEHYLMLAELTGDQKVNYDKHSKLFFLVNDTSVLKRLHDAASESGDAPGVAAAIDTYRFRVALNAVVLSHYLALLEENLAGETMQDMLEGDTAKAMEIYQGARQSYTTALRRLASSDDYFAQQLQALSQEDNLPALSPVPLAIGMVLDEETDLLNIYMSKEMGDQLRAWMASQQAGALNPARQPDEPAPE